MLVGSLSETLGLEPYGTRHTVLCEKSFHGFEIKALKLPRITNDIVDTHLGSDLPSICRKGNLQCLTMFFLGATDNAFKCSSQH